MICVNSSEKVLSPQYEGPFTHVFRTSLLYTFIISRKKEIGFVAKFFTKYFFWPKVISNYMSTQVPRSRNQVKLSINKTKVDGLF